jgi:hypothetical protein
MEIAIEKLAVICFFLFGISHIVQPRSWAEFFIRLREKGTTGSFINGWIHLPLGALIVAFHNVWHGRKIWSSLVYAFAAGHPSKAVTMFVLIRAVTYAALLSASCWFTCPVGSCRGRALLRRQLPERRKSRGCSW